jgi:hypothetical protein
MKPCAKYVTIACLSGLLTSFPIAAQTNPEAENAQELRRQLDELRAQMEAQTGLMNKIQARLDDLEKAKAPAPLVAEAVAEVDKQQVPAPSPPSAYLSDAIRNYRTFSQDQLAAARFDNIPLDPKYPGFFRLPGTSTFLKIGGYFETDIIEDLKPAGNPDAFVPSSIPVGVPPVNNSTISIRPTRMSLDFRVPVQALDDVRVYLEADLFGTNSTTPHLRHAYTQAKNLLIGQTFSNFMDPDAGPDQIDYQGPNGWVAIRNPQVRYSFKLAEKTGFRIALEKASSDVTFKTPEFSALPDSPTPDGTLALRHQYESGHIQVSGLFRSVAAYLVNGKSDTVFGWGTSIAGSQRVIGRDTLVYQGAYGAGMERYVNDTSGLGIDAGLISAQQPYLKALPIVATYFGYQHWWSSRVRSSAIYGFVQVTNTQYQPGDTFHKSDYMATNLIWNPFGSLNVGGEFLYGWVVKKNGTSGNAPRIIISAKYDLNFAKKP